MGIVPDGGKSHFARTFHIVKGGSELKSLLIDKATQERLGIKRNLETKAATKLV